MFDVGFWELALIFVVALVIIGPQRLPGAAHTVGMWVGKGRRMLRDVKTDLDREIREHNIAGMAAVKEEMDDIKNAGTTIKQAGEEMGDSATAWKDSLTEVSPTNNAPSRKKKSKAKRKTKKQHTAGNAYFLYESKAGQHKAVLHRGNCTFCRQGNGRAGGKKTGKQHGQWHGPFSNLAIARRRQQALDAKVEKECGTCMPRKK